MANHLALIVSIAVVIFGMSLFEGVASNPVVSPESVRYTDESFPRDELIKVYRSQLMQKLNWSEADLENATKPDLSEDEVQLLMIGEEEHEPRDRVIVRPNNKIFTCFGDEEHNCSRFEFVVTTEWDRVENLLVWFRKEQRTSQLDITVNFQGMSDIYHYDEDNLDVIIERGRIGFNLIKPDIDQVGNTVQCTIETRGSSVHKDKGNGPLLVVSRTQEPAAGRHRRSSRTQRTPTNCNCCVVDRVVTTSELKMDRVIYHPKVMNMRACRGTCRLDQSQFGNDYGGFMYNLLKHNASMMENLNEFWVPRCYPSKMRSMVIFYMDREQNQVVQVNVIDMVVESCSCTAYNCYSHQ